MPDSQLAKLKRSWEISRSFEDEVAYLHARARAGELTPTQLSLAATCGHLPAIQLTGHDCAGSMATCFRCWHEVSVLTRFTHAGGRDVAIRTALAGARRHLEHWDEVYATGGREALSAHAWHTWRPRGRRQLARRWRAPLAAALDLAEESAAETSRDTGPELERALRRLTPKHPFNLRWIQLPLTLLLDRPSPYATDWPGLVRGLDYATVFEAVRADLAPWLLGYRDPLAERVTSRRESPGG